MTSSAFGRFAALAALFASATLGAGPAQAETTVLRNFTLVDGTGRAPAPGSALVMTDGRITWVGPAAQAKAPADARTVDLAGKYVTPGLIDLHTHIGITVDMKQAIANYTRESVERELKIYARYGVTSVQVMGTDKDLIFDLRAQQRAGRPTMARVFTAGQGLVFKGGYGGVVGLNKPVATPEEAVKAVDEQADKGVDLIKMWVDDELGTMPAMPPAVTKAAIDEAHRRGLKAVAHIFYLADAKRLVDQGVDGLAHSVRDQPVDQALIDAMKAKGTWQIAETLARESAMFAFAEPQPYLADPFFRQAATSPETLAIMASPERRKAIEGNPHFHDFPKFLAQAEANTATLAKSGVKYGFGTDSGPPGRLPGYSSHRELELMVAAGMTPLQALTAATGTAAEFLGSKDLGTVQAGRWADLLVLDADPTASILNSRKISAVYIAGQKVPSIDR